MPKKICDVYDPLLPTLLISIHKIYVKQILSGKKVIEYRKKFFNDPFQAFVYTTGKMVVLKCLSNAMPQL